MYVTLAVSGLPRWPGVTFSTIALPSTVSSWRSAPAVPVSSLRSVKNTTDVGVADSIERALDHAGLTSLRHAHTCERSWRAAVRSSGAVISDRTCPPPVVIPR